MAKKSSPTNSESESLTVQKLAQLIHVAKGVKVLLDSDLAAMYGVTTKVLNQAVKRNIARFPDDFMFQLTSEEAEILRSQIVTSSSDNQSSTGQYGGRRYLPNAFTEQGVAMLSSVLRSERAIDVNIAIMRTFVKLREVLATHKDLASKLDAIERKLGENDENFRVIFDAIRQLMAPPPTSQKKSRIGFKT